VPLLEVEGLGVTFGGLQALQDVHFQVAEGAIHGLIGPNGAGKTTAFNCITRLLTPTAGAIRFGGKDLLQVAPSDVVRLGISRTFQNLELCRHQTALENVMLGLYHRIAASPLAYALRLPAAVRAEAESRREALAALERVGCQAYAGQIVGGLPYGVLKRIEIARALVARPRLLLLDEPAAGVTSGERAALADLIRQVRSEGITVLMVEHDMSMVMSLCDQITVLDFGRVIAAGTAEQVQHDPAVIAAYLGVADEEVEANASAG
jgi:ABC-type branched-subunit amino acid transport system ATPase component